jgi:gliding motility-associated-like protein
VVSINVDTYPSVFVLQPAYSEYCAGEAGVQLYLSGFEPFVVYELFETSDLTTSVGTSVLAGGIMVWNDVPEGDYQVKATRLNGLGLSQMFPTVVEVREQPAPAVFNVTPTGTTAVCPVVISLDGSEVGINYHLLLNDVFFSGPVAGDGGSLDMGSHSVGGIYTIEAVNTLTGCTSLMNGSLDLTAVPNSGVFNLESDPSDGIYCEGSDGVRLHLSGSTVGAAYEVYRNNISTGVTALGDGDQIVFGPFTEAGFYRVMIAAQGGCLYPMDGVVEVSMDPSPDAFTLEADNAGHFCAGDPTGVEIRQVGQQNGVVYQLYYEGVAQGSAMIGSVSDPAQVYSFGTFSLPGEYTVMGSMPVSGCEGLIGSITLTEDPLPQEFLVTGETGFCAGGGLAVIELSGSQSGVEYELYLDDSPTGYSEIGNGGLIQFSIDTEGRYTVRATDESTSCFALMTGHVDVVEKPLPDNNVKILETFTGSDCDIDATITVENSQIGVEYEIYWWVDVDNNGPTGFVVTGDGTSIDFPVVDFDGNGTYKVLASLEGCEVFLLDGFEVNIPGLINKYAIQGDGTICEGDAGINILLSSSEADVIYVLWSIGAGVGGVDVPVSTIDTNDPDYTPGQPLDFGLIAEAGDYIILASNEDCIDIPMHGMVELRFNPLPIAYQITGSGVFCDAFGAEIGLDGSEVGVLYTLVYDGDPIPRVRGTAIGSGDVLTFAGVFEEGPYTVYARNELTGCTSSMNGLVTVTQASEPDVSGITVTTTSPYCDSEFGAEVSLSTSEPGITYVIYDGSEQVTASALGNGAALTFGALIPEGTYSIRAMRGEGDCEVSFASSFTITSDAAPAIPTLVNLDGQLSVEIPVVDLTYSLYHVEGGVPTMVSPAIEYDGSNDISWSVLASGSYYVEASWTINACTSLSETISVGIVTPPVGDYTLVPDQELSYCSADGAGVIVSISGSSPDVYYELVNVDDLNNPLQILKGNGTTVSFSNLVTGTATYTITVEGDNSKFSVGEDNEFTITEYITPEVFTVNSGAANQSVLLSDSEEEVWYFLIRDGEYAYDLPNFGIKGTGETLEFLSVEMPGDYYVLAVGENGGCEALMSGFVRIHQSQLKAIPDTLYLDANELSGSIDLSALITGRTSSDVNLVYSGRIINEALAGSLTIDENSGLLTYYKAPSFFGKDSLHYTVANPTIAARKSTSYIIIMAGNKDFGEVQSFLLPNAFSPNGDGINDRFVISGLGLTEESSIEVFNRWGTIVYRSEGKNYDNNWDGTSNVGAMISIGKELPNGVYFYVFEVKKNVEGSVQTKRFSGYVELRR